MPLAQHDPIQPTKARSALLQAGLFFAITFVWSWGFWIPAARLGLDTAALPVRILGLLGLLGPSGAAIGLIWFREPQDVRLGYWRRIVEVRRIPLSWFLVVLLTPLVVTALAFLFSGDAVRWNESARRFLTHPWSLFPFVLFLLFFGPVPEELGWRGYALDRLQARWSPAAASLVLGVAWAAWHLPIFWIEGTYQSHLGIGTLLFWTFLIDIAAQAVVFTLVYNNTCRSTLSAILLHFSINFTGECFDLTERGQGVRTLLWVLLATAILVKTGARPLPGTSATGSKRRKRIVE